MTLLGIFVLSSAIGINSVRTPSSEKEDAYKALAKATYIQTNSDKKLKEIEKKYIPKELKEYGGWITGTTKIIVDKKISFEWTF